ncbi:hypothetical protein VNI00_002802 [Paramarasmius palmivorus]|uniref:Methyltransferase type 11 domain-containing protein n=1 Tax=Paramarasmius palmivorus TaxID=297713 RepID=A0AAW0DX82_9AGAR
MSEDPSSHSNFVVLNRGDAERERLNQMFEFYKTFHNRNLIVDPAYSTQQQEQASTSRQVSGLILIESLGAWVLSLAKELPPTTKLYAVDLAPTLWPSHDVPPNVHYTVSSVTSLPKDWSSKFDLVNQSLLGSSLKASDWPLDVAELYRVTKPGGNLQLVDVTGLPVYPKPPEGTAARAVWEFWSGLKKKAGYLESVPCEVPSMLENVGFCDVRVQIKAAPKLGRRFGGEEGVEALEIAKKSLVAMKEVVLLNDGFGIVKDEKDFDELVEKFETEPEEMVAATGLEFCFICAKKPA